MKKKKRIDHEFLRSTSSASAITNSPQWLMRLMTLGSEGRTPHAVPLRVLAAYPPTPIPPSRNTLDGRDDPDEDSSQEMSRPPNDRTSRSASAHSSARRSASRPRRVPYLPQSSDVHINPDSPVSERAAELIHEFVHPHHHHHSQENLLEAEEELDETGGDAAVIAQELEEMQSRVWWRRPSALWYTLYMPPMHTTLTTLFLRRFLCLIPFVLAASTTTAAPKIQVITRLVCKTLRPEYSDRSGADTPTTYFSASDDEETKLCNADPVVQAASAEFVTCKRPPIHLIKAPEPNVLDLSSNYHCNWHPELLNYRILGIGKFPHLFVRFPQCLTGHCVRGLSARIARAASTP